SRRSTKTGSGWRRPERNKPDSLYGLPRPQEYFVPKRLLQQVGARETVTQVLPEPFGIRHPDVVSALGRPALHRVEVFVLAVLRSQPGPLRLMTGKHALLHGHDLPDIDDQRGGRAPSVHIDELDRVGVEDRWNRLAGLRPSGAPVRDRRRKRGL